MPILHTLLQLSNFKNPFLRTLVPSIGLAFGIQAAVAIPSILAESERFYDLSGSLTYLSCTALSLYLPAIRARAAARLTGAPLPVFPSLLGPFNGTAGSLGFNWRQVVLSAAVSIWATRLGSFLFQRILSEGEDSRFQGIRGNPPKFLAAFLAQATWVSVCLMPVLAINSLPASTFAALSSSSRLLVSTTDTVGILLYVGGLAFETTADRQKRRWQQQRKQKKHDQDFLTTGLWSTSRHPNYFGEIALWTGIATVAGGVLLAPGVAASVGFRARILGLLVAGVSPVFVAFLLCRVSGVPLSERKYDARFGHREDYRRWKRETPVLVPKFW